MAEYNYPLQIRWADLDPNFHLRHSVYYDWGAYCRILFFNQHKLTVEVMRRLNIGPIIFREECVFKKEIRLVDEVTINILLIKAKRDFSRWSVQHQIIKSEQIISALLTVDLAWLNTVERKLAYPGKDIQEVIDQIPKHDQFEWVDKSTI
jgi:acyl-CoA thioester hydrolase